MLKKEFYTYLLNEIIKEVSIKYSYSIIDENLINDIKLFIINFVLSRFGFKLNEEYIDIKFDGNALVVNVNIDKIPDDELEKIISSNLEKFL